MGQEHFLWYLQGSSAVLLRPWDFYLDRPSGNTVTAVPYLSDIFLAAR